MIFFWASERAAGRELGGAVRDRIQPPYPALMETGHGSGENLLARPDGLEIKHLLDHFMPKSQVIIAAAARPRIVADERQTHPRHRTVARAGRARRIPPSARQPVQRLPALLDGINQRVQFWWGVDLFFAISGFVIARTLIPQLREAPTPGILGTGAVLLDPPRLPPAALGLAVAGADPGLLPAAEPLRSLRQPVGQPRGEPRRFPPDRQLPLRRRFLPLRIRCQLRLLEPFLEEQFYLLLPLLILCLRRYLGWALLALVLVSSSACARRC